MMSLSLSHFFKPSLLHVNTFLDTSHEPVISSNLSVRALERATTHRYLIVLEYQGYKIKTHQTRPDLLGCWYWQVLTIELVIPALQVFHPTPMCHQFFSKSMTSPPPSLENNDVICGQPLSKRAREIRNDTPRILDAMIRIFFKDLQSLFSLF